MIGSVGDFTPRNTPFISRLYAIYYPLILTSDLDIQVSKGTPWSPATFARTPGMVDATDIGRQAGDSGAGWTPISHQQKRKVCFLSIFEGYIPQKKISLTTGSSKAELSFETSTMIMCFFKDLRKRVSLPETKMVPGNRPNTRKESSLPTFHFQVLC